MDIQNAIRSLPATDFAVFSKWFDEYEQTHWDDQLASDQAAPSGLTSAIEQAKNAFRNGTCTRL
jgi:hypothetical protein